MSKKASTSEHYRHWRMGVDVGDRSVGLAAIEYDGDTPVNLLAAVSFIHDGGAGTFNNTTKLSRKANYGIRRRMRRGRTRRRKRLESLDIHLESHGIPLPPPENPDAFAAWHARKRLIEDFVDDEGERKQLLGLALSHLARHRGWRNPWITLAAVEQLSVPSQVFADTVSKLMDEPSAPKQPPRTIGELGAYLQTLKGRRLNSSKPKAASNLLTSHPRQEDLVAELRLICATQKIESKQADELVRLVFEQAKPSVPVERVGPCPLVKGQVRALRCSLEFEEFRIRQDVANLRLKNETEKHLPLEPDLAESVVQALLEWDDTAPSWADVALDVMHLDDEGLLHFGDEDRLNQRAPIDKTSRLVKAKLESVKKELPIIRQWWREATREEKSDLVCALVDATTSSFFEGIENFPESELTSLLRLFSKTKQTSLPSGRAEYSRQALARLNRRMIDDGVDLYEARRREFSLPADWAPPLPSLNEYTGQPTVDTNLSIVRKFLFSAELKYGPPSRITVEIAREGASSPKKIQDDESKRRCGQQWNASVRKELEESGIPNPSRADVWRKTLIGLYEGRCLYCDAPIAFKTCELDHIVPRSDGGTNRRSNLVAVCQPCNSKKSSRPFGLYAKESGIDAKAVADRVKNLKYQEGGAFSKRTEFNAYKIDLLRRLKRVSPDGTDVRGIEATSYSATAIRDRLQHFLTSRGIDEQVRAIPGGITAEARWVGGITIVTLLGRKDLPRGFDRKRIDRRHHAIDAAVLTTLDSGIVQSLARRRRDRKEREYSWSNSDEKMVKWRTDWEKKASRTKSLQRWLSSSDKVKKVLEAAVAADKIVVTRPLRLRPNDPAHKETVVALENRKLGNSWCTTEVMRIADPQIYKLLVDELDGQSVIPEDSDRELLVAGNKRLIAQSDIPLFPADMAMIRVRGGAAKMFVIHHARIYAWRDKKKNIKFGMIRVFLADLAQCGMLRSGVDLFDAFLPLACMSYRVADPETMSRIFDGSAKYLGWLVAKDEIEFGPKWTPKDTGMIASFYRQFPEHRWMITGFEGPRQFSLKPSYLAAEGIRDLSTITSDCEKILKGNGWRPSINVLFGDEDLTIIRRSSLGVPRWVGSSLPTSWKVRDRISELFE